MKCPYCDSNIPDQSIVCTHCGNAVAEVGKNKKNNVRRSRSKKTSPEKKSTGRLQMFKIIATIVLIMAVIIFGAILITSMMPGEGEKVFNGISEKIGRSVEIAENNAEIKLATDSEYSVLHEIIPYNYIYTAEKTTKVGGVHLPKWAVYVQTVEAPPSKTADATRDELVGNVVDGQDEDLNELIPNKVVPAKEVIDTVTYYNFEVLSHNWKGQKTDGIIDTNSITYNLPRKKVQKLVGIDPLFIRQSSNDITTYCYKYYYVDSQSGNEKAMYLEVNYSPDGTVKNATSRKNDYIAFLFK